MHGKRQTQHQCIHKHCMAIHARFGNSGLWPRDMLHWAFSGRAFSRLVPLWLVKSWENSTHQTDKLPIAMNARAFFAESTRRKFNSVASFGSCHTWFASLYRVLWKNDDGPSQTLPKSICFHCNNVTRLLLDTNLCCSALPAHKNQSR